MVEKHMTLLLLVLPQFCITLAGNYRFSELNSKGTSRRYFPDSQWVSSKIIIKTTSHN